MQVRLINPKKRVYAYIIGEGQNLNAFQKVLVRHGTVKDLIGIKYKIIRGKFDMEGIEQKRRRRSYFGTKMHPFKCMQIGRAHV